jgi:hypothetical protein
MRPRIAFYCRLQMNRLQMNQGCGLSEIVAFKMGLREMSVTPHDLVSKVASLLRMPVSRVKNFDRKLMEAGFRTKKGHGRGSAIMTSTDAAMLLVAIASSDEVGFAAQSTSLTLNFPLARDEHQPDGPSSAVLASLCDRIGGRPGDYPKFGDAIDAIMNHLVERDRNYQFSFRVGAAGQIPLTAEIALFDEKEVQRIRFMHFAGTAMSGLNVERTIPPSALSGIASLIAGRAPVDELAALIAASRKAAGL